MRCLCRQGIRKQINSPELKKIQIFHKKKAPFGGQWITGQSKKTYQEGKRAGKEGEKSKVRSGGRNSLRGAEARGGREEEILQEN